MSILNSVMSYFGFVKREQELDELNRVNLAGRALMYVEGHAPKQLSVKPNSPDDNVHVNFARQLTEKKIAFLFSEPLKISIGSDGDTRGTNYLEQVWPQEQRDQDFLDMAHDGAVSGDVWLKIVIQPDNSPRVVVGDPNCYSAVTDPNDVARVTAYRCEYESQDTQGNKFIYREETTPREDGKAWLIQEYHSYDGGKTFAPVGTGVTWNFSFAPIFHCKNLPKSKSFYGTPDLRPDVLRLIDALARVDSLCNKIIRIHASPKPYARGLKAADLELGTESMVFLGQGMQGIQAEIGLLEMKGDLTGALALRKVLREGLSEVTGVPEIATGKMEHTGQLSGVALQIMYGPLVDQTKVKQRLYGKLIKDVVSALMAIGHIAGAVTLHWTNPLPIDEQGMLEGALIKKQFGVSDETLQLEAGYDPEVERERSTRNVQNVGTHLLNGFNSGADMATVN